MTESSPVTSMCTFDDSEMKKATTCGKPIDYIECKIIDTKTNEIVELEQEGELLVRGHNLMVEYFEDEAKTKETITPNR